MLWNVNLSLKKIYVNGVEYDQKVENPITPIANAIKADNIDEVKKY
ncbi:putative ankyrin repeat protein [Rickettsia parkeri str. Grand Bay]|nr:putative ankyrin repeat protein [Rickettsia parkeri str. Grand Bay]